MIKKLPISMLKCLLATIIIELIVALIIGIRNKKDILNIILVNIMTNPLVTSIPFYLNIKYGLIYRHISLIFLEILTLFAEGYVYYKYLDYKRINPFIISLILNISSYFIGLLIGPIIL